MVVHGFGGGRNLSPSTDMRKAYFTHGNYNIIIVDYGSLVKEPCLSQVCISFYQYLLIYLFSLFIVMYTDKANELCYTMLYVCFCMEKFGLPAPSGVFSYRVRFHQRFARMKKNQ